MNVINTSQHNVHKFFRTFIVIWQFGIGYNVHYTVTNCGEHGNEFYILLRSINNRYLLLIDKISSRLKSS